MWALVALHLSATAAHAEQACRVEPVKLRSGVFVVAGAWFGMEGHLRIGIGGERETLEEGLHRLDAVLDRL